MILFGDRVVCSTGDLVSAARCEFALLRALDAELGLVTSIGYPAPGELAHAWNPAVEQCLADLRDRYGAGVVRVPVPAEHADPEAALAGLRRAHEQTLAALRGHADAVAGAVVFDGEFATRCDFLVRDSDPETHDYLPAAVATRHTRIPALLTLAATADALRRFGFRPAARARLWVDGVASTHSLADIAVVHRARRDRLNRILEDKLGELLPVQWGDRRFLACGHCSACTAELETRRDLLLVAGMRSATRAQLRDAGITTVDRLAAADATVTGVPAPTFSALRRQAELQLEREHTGLPTHTLIDAAALAALPRPSRGDLFVSVAAPDRLEVWSNWSADRVHTFTIRVGGTPPGSESAAAPELPVWDDDADALLDFLSERQWEHPDLRIHHYRGNLRPLLSRIGERYPDGEDVVADLLPALVDLYPIVRATMIVGERSYDLRQLPPNRTAANAEGMTAERTAADGLAGSGPEAVRQLRDWLLGLAREHGVQPARRMSYDYWETGPDEVEAALREFAETGYRDGSERGPAQVAAAFTAAAVGYFRRERKPLSWAHDDRLDHPVEEWAETPGVLVADWGTVDTKWHSTGQRPMRRYLTLTGRLGTGNAPPPGTRVLTLYDRPARGMTAVPGRRAAAHATVLGCALDTNFEDVVRVVELLPEGCEPYDELPNAIAPCPPRRNDNLEESLEDIAHQLLVTLPEVPGNAVFDLLCARPPRLRGGAPLPEVFGDHAAAVTAAILELENSYVAVQGPPGTGKTDITARVVERLVTRYKWRVGVVGRSHAVVEHVLDAVVQVGVLPELVAKAEAQSVAPEWLPIDAAKYGRFLDNAVNGGVVGGLSNDFTDPERIARDSLDLLVIADAGRFPLADAAAVALCARNLLLVGDPAPATGHGIHPESVDESALGRLVGAHRTLPATFGYFLDRTWRMHPRVCGPVSRLRYDNRLRSNETVTLARELEGIEPGVRTVTIEHHGNSTESAEEAREIVRQVRNLLGLPWQTGAVTRRLHPHDILVVAPYHAQVARIRTLLSRARIEDVLVGTADHFQGREAAVVLVSMATSAPKDAPHGIGALLSRHWLTSAISRAMWSAIIVRSPLLTEYLPATTTELGDLAAVLQLDRV
ncbi:AAA domain-containing protein [Nocardia acidivorans]|uniref:AAA domain-containing protein n=1 Tax=Nocardia acidivorans TaxID=404580 RepID=UPI0008352839|nr:bifunctional RecB family nuclease/DEAD/DEAH box helicase [Nocardia acidivorans]